MQGRDAWMWRSLASMVLVGGGAGLLIVETQMVSMATLLGAFVAASVSGPALGLYLYASGGRGGPALAGLASWLGMLAFVGVPLVLEGLREGFGDFDAAAIQIILGIVPLMAGGVGAAGTGVLCSGVGRPRAGRLGHAAATDPPAAVDPVDAPQNG